MSDRRRCCVLSCRFATQPIVEGVRLFGLPKDQIQQTQWRQWINIQNKQECNTKNIFICSNHFLAEEKGNRKLKRGAVPSISVNDNGAEEHHQQVENHGQELQVECVAEQVYQQTEENQGQEQAVECVNVQPIQYFQLHQSGVYTATENIHQLERNQHQHETNQPPIVTAQPDQYNQYAFSSVVEIDMNQPDACSILAETGSFNLDTLFDEPEGYSILTETGSFNLDTLFDEENNNVFERGNFVQEQICPTLDNGNNLTSVISIPDDRSNARNDVLCRRTNQVEVPPNKLKTNTSRKCFAENCSNSNRQTVHTFPAIVINGQINHENLNRCKLWIKNSGNIELLNQYSSKLHGKHGLCSDHFDSSQYYNPQTRKRLLSKAVPTLYFSLPISDNDMIRFPKWGPDDIFADMTANDIENGTNESHVENDQQQNNHDTNEQCFRPDEYQNKFENILHTLEWRTCNSCKEKFFTKKSSKKQCSHSKPICSALSSENGFDPGDSKQLYHKLKYLSISALNIFMSFFYIFAC
ncbi:uncharacterized protein LOC117650102 [Thrips palmi]|uniref:Uncharacterized protein LOC117650102 n=1 Tax=Thrips palmi TaxID=161013 RepID=A0A6P8ZVF0_THRPL|nr:uncharacterized protein LOC117650102 [Thrips palmi]